MKIEINGLDKFPVDNRKPMGGTELMRQWLFENVDNDLLNKFQIISTRVRGLEDKPRILWLHDLPEDPECAHLMGQENVDNFCKFVCVSNWQKERFLHVFNQTLDSKNMIVLKNAIYPMEAPPKPTEQIRLIYHTTPHRGLNILLMAFQQLYKQFGDKIHLDVFSSLKLYCRDEQDKQFEPLYDFCRNHPGITYHGSVSNDTVRKALETSHIFAYPCTWLETSCIAAIEAMSAKCVVVAPDLGALPETMGNFGVSYPYDKNIEEHARNFIHIMENVIQQFLAGVIPQQHLEMQKHYIDNFYGWHARKLDWEAFLKNELARQERKEIT